MDNLNMINVAEAAAEKGWHVIDYHKERSRDGHIPGGHIAFVRGNAPFEDKRCGTISWGLNDYGVMFAHGP